MDTLGGLGWDLRNIQLDDVVTLNDQVDDTEVSLLLQLPDPCLLAVLQYCADDPRSVFSAARAHSRLHEAAVLATTSVTADYNGQPADSVIEYLTSHGQHIEDLEMTCVQGPFALRWLPPNLQKLTSLSFSNMNLKLLSGQHCQGVLGARPPLKQLHLHRCTLLDGEVGLAAALLQLPTLQHLTLSGESDPFTLNGPDWISQFVVRALQQLTHLALSVTVRDPPGMRHLPGLTNLQDLRLRIKGGVTASMLSGLQLTQFELHGVHSQSSFDPGALSGKTQLQHVVLLQCPMPDRSAGVAQLLSQLQQLQQLTHLDLRHSLLEVAPAAAAYSALTASSKLHHLDFSGSCLPLGTWQHIFPAGRQLPHLRQLTCGDVHCCHAGLPFRTPMEAPESSRLVSCCRGLQSLDMQGLLYSSELLADLPKLTCLQQLALRPAYRSLGGLEVVCQLTGLRQLQVHQPLAHPAFRGVLTAEELLLHLTKLRRLTSLECTGFVRAVQWRKWYTVQAPGDEPVWRQVLKDHRGHSNPDVAQQAAAALAESDSKQLAV